MEPAKAKFTIGDKVMFKMNDVVYRDDNYIDEVMVTEKGFSYVILHDEDTYDVLESDIRRRPTHISPTGLFLFELNQAEYYMKYCSFSRPPRVQQTKPMSVGSAFDAYVKSYILKCLKGSEAPDSHSFEKLFMTQVEPQNRDWALKAGKHAFDSYKTSGALSDLMLELSQGDTEPRFEFEIKGIVKSEGLGVPILGRPDMYFTNKHGARVVGDWKVNGYEAKTAVSPKPNYVQCRDGWIGQQSKSHRTQHNAALPMLDRGIMVNVACSMEDIENTWATQLAAYGWLMGEEVGSDFICALEQLACTPVSGEPPRIRVASFRNQVSPAFQRITYQRFKQCWEKTDSNHFFSELSKEESDLKCEGLEKIAADLWPTGDAKHDWFVENCR